MYKPQLSLLTKQFLELIIAPTVCRNNNASPVLFEKSLTLYPHTNCNSKVNGWQKVEQIHQGFMVYAFVLRNDWASMTCNAVKQAK